MKTCGETRKRSRKYSWTWTLKQKIEVSEIIEIIWWALENNKQFSFSEGSRVYPWLIILKRNAHRQKRYCGCCPFIKYFKWKRELRCVWLRRKSIKSFQRTKTRFCLIMVFNVGNFCDVVDLNAFPFRGFQNNQTSRLSALHCFSCVLMNLVIFRA